MSAEPMSILSEGDPRQSPCPCSVCLRDEPKGCYGVDADRTARPDEKCWPDDCECWGGQDRECSACWIDGK